jgi:hypothetical protein
LPINARAEANSSPTIKTDPPTARRDFALDRGIATLYPEA